MSVLGTIGTNLRGVKDLFRPNVARRTRLSHRTGAIGWPRTLHCSRARTLASIYAVFLPVRRNERRLLADGRLGKTRVATPLVTSARGPAPPEPPRMRLRGESTRRLTRGIASRRHLRLGVSRLAVRQ